MASSNNIKRWQNKKPNLVYLSGPGTLFDYPLDNPNYRQSITDFLKLAESKFNVFYVRGTKKYLGSGVFSGGFKFKKGKFIRQKEKIYARVIFNKAPLHCNGGKNWSVLNKWSTFSVMNDKFRTYQILKKFMKPTYRIKNKTDFNKQIKKIQTAKAVFKPLHGIEGKGIVIVDKKKIKNKLKSFDGILQDFIDTSGGVPGICKTRHDMRILIMNGRIVQTYARIPKKGSLLANIAQGGKMLEIKKSAVPKQAIKIALSIDNKFSKIGGRMYAIDFGFENKKPYIFELNPRPGFPYPQWKMYYSRWHRELLKTLIECIK